MVHWHITKENLSLLDNFQDIEAGTLDLQGNNIDADTVKHMIHFVAEHGSLLHTLVIRPQWSMELGDFEHVDFATHCPHLRTLDLKRMAVNESVFAHPSLEILSLLEVNCKGPQTIIIGNSLSERSSFQLKEVHMMDCSVSAQTLTIGPSAQLKIFQYYLDEDFAEPDVSPDPFVFQACPRLEEITIHVCGSWDIVINGLLPQLERISLDATAYGSYRCKIEGVDDQQEARYRQMFA